MVVLLLPGAAVAFELAFDADDFAAVTPTFSQVTDFEFAIEFAGPLAPGVFDERDVVEVRYVVSGGLSQTPPTPSGFASFMLNRTSAGEGPISGSEFVAQGSTLVFEIPAQADLSDGLQLGELVGQGVVLEIDAREFERLDRARYHPPQLILEANGTGLIRNSNNSSGSTGTVNPATMMTVDVDFGDEYVSLLAFDPASVTLVVPEPGAGAAALAACGALALRRRSAVSR